MRFQDVLYDPVVESYSVTGRVGKQTATGQILFKRGGGFVVNLCLRPMQRRLSSKMLRGVSGHLAAGNVGIIVYASAGFYMFVARNFR